MANQKPLTSKSGEVRELTAADARRAKSFAELPRSLRDKISSRGRGKQKAPTKIPISIRLSPEVVAFYKSQGEGWQNRMDADLQWLTTRP